jgi:1,4-alpha-glucan branching enzyme
MIHKSTSPRGKSAKVTFELPADVAQKSVAIVGDFNEWNEKKDQMKLDAKKGVWSKTLSLKPGATYEFRYFIDEQQWRNDEQADRYESNPFFTENSVIEV